MKDVLKVVFQIFLFACLLTSIAGVASAQGSSADQPAADNTKVNQRDKNKAEPTADQQKENRPDREIARQIRISPYPAMRITSRSSRRTVWSR